jgi:hypothetical protein
MAVNILIPTGVAYPAGGSDLWPWQPPRSAARSMP